MAKGYDLDSVYETCHGRGVLAVTPLKGDAGRKARKHRPPECEHGTWTFAGPTSSGS